MSDERPDREREEEAEAPWDADNTGTIWFWAVLIGLAALLFPLVLNLWSSELMTGQLTRPGA